MPVAEDTPSGRPICSVDGCGRFRLARGWCGMHYHRWRRTLPGVKEGQREQDRQRRKTPERQAQERARERSPKRREYQRAWAAARFDWGAWWERQRRVEDRRELRTWRPKVWPACRIVDRPRARRFIGRVCVACGATWVSYEAMPDTDHCAPCNRKRWKGSHRARTRRYGGRYEHVAPQAIFKRDGYRCQLCGVKTKGTAPSPRSPTLDHIVPLALGGAHSEENLQCACWTCNITKRAGAANDQLRLPVAA